MHRRSAEMKLRGQRLYTSRLNRIGYPHDRGIAVLVRLFDCNLIIEHTIRRLLVVRDVVVFTF